MTRFLCTIIFTFLSFLIYGQSEIRFNDDWEFARDLDPGLTPVEISDDTSTDWERITLPHTAYLEPVEDTVHQWQGICYYRKTFDLSGDSRGKHIGVKFEAAMQVAEIYLNGSLLTTHYGGYLPFYLDLTDRFLPGAPNVLLLKLTNTNASEVPPGKPLEELDFNYYSGLYRNAFLIITDKLHISEPIAPEEEEGGGVMIHADIFTDSSAALIIRAEVVNDHRIDKSARIRWSLTEDNGREVVNGWTEEKRIKAGDHGVFNDTLTVAFPSLWSPEHPFIYRLKTTVHNQNVITDQKIITTGIREVRIRDNTLYINGQPTIIRGTNRHQEYPYIGYALPDNCQYRDAYKIRAAGFNFVRSSHYPPSPAFLEACDELGLLVMDAIPGWQFFGDEEFQQRSLQDVHGMIRRDRNHPSIILWEASLNETSMTDSYMQKAHAIVHKELPFEGIYSAGWMDTVYDVFLPARQHARAPDYWKKRDSTRPYLIAEYGDWEYYAQNAGFNQKNYADLQPEERSSRQRRKDGERRLLQQALNYREAHNDNLYGSALGDANWLMFDYKRGYAPDIEASGIMDIFRLPKFSYYFYKSQQPARMTVNPQEAPVLFIANYLTRDSPSVIQIFSNCEEVELRVNGRSLGRHLPDTSRLSTNLAHPPFSFQLEDSNPREITAIGYIHQKPVCSASRISPEASSQLLLNVDFSGKKPVEGDILFVHVTIADKNGTPVYDASDAIRFTIEGNARIIGPSIVKAEAGIATILIKIGKGKTSIDLEASADNLYPVRERIIIE